MKYLSIILALLAGVFLASISNDLTSDGTRVVIKEVSRLILEIGVTFGFVIYARKTQRLKALLAKHGISEDEL